MLLDANVVAAHYLSKASTPKIALRMEKILAASRTRGKAGNSLILYVPNFCVAEVFNVFRKYRFGKWSRKVLSNGPIPQREYQHIYAKFQKDIHNGRLFYHYELSRYHLLNTALVSPIDHHYAYERQGKEKKNPSPMSTFDLLIIGIAIELVRLHGKENVVLVTADNRIRQIMRRAATIPESVVKELGLHQAARLVGTRFSNSLYPQVLHLGHASTAEFERLLH